MRGWSRRRDNDRPIANVFPACAGVVPKEPGVVVVCEDEPDVRASIIEAVTEIFPEAEIVALEIDGDYGLTQEDIDLILQVVGL